MNVHEWPLTAFTILAQMAVGAFITLGFINVFARTKYSSRTVDRLANPALYAIGPIMVLALVASIFHLGTPLNAPNAIRHIATSWLAREILFGAGFAALGFAFAIVQWFNWFNATVRNLLATITALWGIAFIWVMANVYMLPTVPAWNHWTTPATFYISAALTGSLAIAVAFTAWPFVSNKWPKLDRTLTGKHTSEASHRNPVIASDKEVISESQELTNKVVKWIGIVIVLLLALQLAVNVFSTMKPGSPNPAEIEFSTGWFVVRIILLIVGAGLMGLYLTMVSTRNLLHQKAKSLFALALTSYALVTISEIIARFMFYAENNRIGI